MPRKRRVVAVTGASGQIGSACVAAFAGEGALVASVDISEGNVASAGGLAIRGDLGDVADVDRIFTSIESELGPVDVLVQSAAVIQRTHFLEMSAENIDYVFRVNVRGLLLCAQRAAKSMISRSTADAVIVNLTSISGVAARAESVAYEASKGAVSMATRSMAVALAPYGIRVNAVAPGFMVKPQEMPRRDVFSLDAYEERRIPIRRFGTPDEIAGAVTFLASPSAAYITGEVLAVDGGVLASI